MTQRMKDKLIGGVIGTVSGLIVGLVLFFFGGVRMEAQAFEDLVDSKVDKEVFQEFKEVNEKEHLKLEAARKSDLETVTKHFDTRIEDLKEWIKLLNEQ